MDTVSSRTCEPSAPSLSRARTLCTSRYLPVFFTLHEIFKFAGPSSEPPAATGVQGPQQQRKSNVAFALMTTYARGCVAY